MYISNLRDSKGLSPLAAADLGEDDGGHGGDAEQPRQVEGHDLAQHQLLVRLPVPAQHPQCQFQFSVTSAEFPQYSENIVADKIRDISLCISTPQ